jgi:hypothetical protein
MSKIRVYIITNFMGHDLAIIIMWNLLFICSCEIDLNVIHLLVLFEHQCHAHCLNTNVICLSILFELKYCMFICVICTWKLCTWFSCLNNTNLWNNKFCMNLELTHETCNFMVSHVKGCISVIGETIKIGAWPMTFELHIVHETQQCHHRWCFHAELGIIVIVWWCDIHHIMH